MNIKTKSQAVQFTHTLSQTSKMPCKSYSLPTSSCKVGAKLRDIPGSTCFGCYADKGCYNWNSTQNAMHKRLKSITGLHWVAGMTKQIKGQDLFRWHDSGDIQGIGHMNKIMDVCKNTPDTRHWIPTREKSIVREWLKSNSLPANVTIRLSGAMIDGKASNLDGVNTSTVHASSDAIGFECKAPANNGECGSCRACWNKDIQNVSYKLH